jgi:hypothetical protein
VTRDERPSAPPGSTPRVAAVTRLRRLATRRARQALYRRARRWQGRPPVVSRHWVPSPPDFVGVGVQRAGTSWWFSLLEAHPQVHRLASATKELHYFDPFCLGEFAAADIVGYHDKFRRPPGRLCGEWTPRYMFDPWTPALLERAAPDAKILVMLRDPVARLYSGLTHAIERGKPVDADTIHNAVSRGLYHGQLTRLLKHFPRDQVLVLQFERCLSEPQSMLRRTQEFLGLHEQLPANRLTRPVNRATIEALTLSRDLLAEVTELYEPDGLALTAAFPEIDLRLWPNFAHLRGPD